MTYYAYNYLLPEDIAEKISDAVVNFAKKEANITYDLWYHGLPVWAVRNRVGNRVGNRVNRVQIDAVLTPDPIISFTPDAYQDTVEDEKGIKMVNRKTVPAAIVLKERQELSVKEAREEAAKISSKLGLTWQRATQLTLDYPLSWHYISPFKL